MRKNMYDAKIIVLCLTAWAQTAGAQTVSVIQSAPGDDRSAAAAVISSDAVKISAQKGLDWLLDYQGREGWDAILIFMRDMDKSYCHSPRIDGYAGKRISELGPEIEKSAYRRFIDGKTTFADRDDVLRRLDRGHHAPYDLLTMAAYCDIRPLSRKVEAQIFDIKSADSSTRYILFNAMVTLDQLGCKNRNKDGYFREMLQRAAETVASDQSSADKNDNIYYERVGLLEAAGYPELVKQEWIRTIAARQLGSGAWPGGAQDSKDPDPNATIRAVWALTRYLKECPLAAKPDPH